MADFKYLELRPQDLDPPPGGTPLTRDEFIKNRLSTLSSIDYFIEHGFQARKLLLEKMQAIGGLSAFKKQWEDGGSYSPNALAKASLVTSKAIEERFGADDLACAYEFGAPPQSKKVKWPVLGIIFPELSPFMLAPADSTKASEHLFGIVERECPELLSADTPTTATLIEAKTLALYFEHCDLCELAPGSSQGLIFQVKGKLLDVNLIKNGAVRLLAISTFLLALDLQHETCIACGSKDGPLRRCSRCHCATYCSKDCQTRHFKEKHKKECKILQELHKRYEDTNPLRDVSSVYLTIESFLHYKLRDKFLAPIKASLEPEIKRFIERGGPITGDRR